MLRGVSRARSPATRSSISAAAAAARCCGTATGAPTTVGIDIAPFFSDDARRDVDLLLGDLRKLPFADGTFTKACSLDVLEHLSPDALRGMLGGSGRVLTPGGALFVYTHVRKNAPIAVGLALDQRAGAAARALGPDRHAAGAPAQVGPPEPAARHPGARAGRARRPDSASARIRYYTPIVGGFVENILMRMAERAMARRAARRLQSAIAGSESAEA